MAIARKMLLAELMRECRASRGTTLAEMAQQAGIGTTCLWQLENRQSVDPRLSTVKAICKAYGFSFARIADFD